MALFVALVLPPPAVADLQAAAEAARTVGTDLPGLRWTRPDQWHLTLAFLGEVPSEHRVAELTDRLARAATRRRGFSLAVRGAGAFSRPAAARIVWAGVAGPPELALLAGAVGAAARRSGIDVESRSFRPHLTLARLRAPADVRPLVAALGLYVGPTWAADAIHLFRSHPGGGPDGRGSRYETLGTWPLGG